jgi:urease beta subunit
LADGGDLAVVVLALALDGDLVDRPAADVAALMMPRCSAIGFAPAARCRVPLVKIASERTVAVVVPSPALSETFLATS